MKLKPIFSKFVLDSTIPVSVCNRLLYRTVNIYNECNINTPKTESVKLGAYIFIMNFVANEATIEKVAGYGQRTTTRNS